MAGVAWSVVVAGCKVADTVFERSICTACCAPTFVVFSLDFSAVFFGVMDEQAVSATILVKAIMEGKESRLRSKVSAQ